MLELIKDTVIPDAVIISSPPAGELLNTATISDAFMGTGEFGAMVTIIVSDGIKSVSQTTVVTSAGQWSTFVNILELDDGNVQIRVNQTDSAGNISPNTSITVNKQATLPESLFIYPIATVNSGTSSIQISGENADADAEILVTLTDRSGISVSISAIYLADSKWQTGFISMESFSFGLITVEAIQISVFDNPSPEASTTFAYASGLCNFNGICDSTENADSCTDDCFEGFFCGNGICELNESPVTCRSDCLLVACGNDICDAQEHPGICSDCFFDDTLCGNRECDFNESPETCTMDCSTGSCRNGICENNEHQGFCEEDCFLNAKCGNRVCDLNESVNSCPSDCNLSTCGNAICESKEQIGTCNDCRPTDSTCGNKVCEYSENTVSCSRDCSTSSCGNGRCERSENAIICSSDCSASSCGNGVCDIREHSGTCSVDCARTCGDSICNANETISNCQ